MNAFGNCLYFVVYKTEPPNKVSKKISTIVQGALVNEGMIFQECDR